MVPTAAQLEDIAGFNTNDSNVNSIVVSLQRFGDAFGITRPHRLAHYLCQTAHESAGYKYDEEIASGAAYEGRKDLGNVKPGDGRRFKGRTGMQITGRANYREFTVWVRKNVDPDCPDFEADPEAVNSDPWEGLVPIWYWVTRKLNALADENNIEQITKKINGGLNGYADRLKRYTRAGLVLLDYGPTDVRHAQVDLKAAGYYAGTIDGDDGPKTRAALHLKLASLSSVAVIGDVKPGPVVTVEEKTVEIPVDKPVAVVPPGADKRSWLWGPLSGISLSSLVPLFVDLTFWQKAAAFGIVLVLVAVILYFGDRIIRRTKALIKEALAD